MTATLEAPSSRRTRLLSAVQVARRAGMNYNTLLHWVRYNVVQAKVHPDKQWCPVLFTEEQAVSIAAKALRVAQLRRALALEIRPLGRCKPTKTRRAAH